MDRFTNISNTQLTLIIDEWIKNERNRKLLKRRFIDGITLEHLAEEFELTVDRVKQIIYAERRTLEVHLKTT